MNWRKFFRQIAGVVYLPNRREYFTHLKSSAPTVTPEEAAKLERKWRKQQPIDFDEFAGPVG